MALIPRILVPVGASLSPLRGDLRAASAEVGRFAATAARKAEIPVSVAMDSGFKPGHALKALATHVAVQRSIERITPVNPGFNAFNAAKAGVDLGANKGADLTIRVAQGTLKAGLAAAKGTVSLAMKAMAAVAVLPITVASIGLKVGLGVAQALAFKKIKEMTGMSTVQIILAYAAFKVGLTVAKRLLSSAVSAMGRAAMVPVRLGLAAFRAGLRTAKNLAAAAGRQIKEVLSVPLKIGAMGLGLGLAGTALGGLVGIPAAVAGAVKSASDLNESLSKTQYAFNGSAGIVIKGADGMARRFGLVKATVIDAAAGIGQIGKAAGLTDAASAKLGVTMTQLAADLSSRDNLPFELALEKIRAGLVGEAEPLRTVGVLLSETAVKAQAAAMGFNKVKGGLTEGQKVMARVEIIQRQLATASGDLARTQSSVANRTRELMGRVRNLGAAMGAYLLPAVESLTGTFAELAGGLASKLTGHDKMFKEWGKKLKEAADYAGLLIRNIGEFKGVAGAAMGDAAKVFGAVFDYGVKYGEYFARSVGRALEDELRKALQDTVGGPMAATILGTTFKGLASLGPGGMLFGGGGAGREPLKPPEFQMPGLSPAFNEAVGRAKANDARDKHASAWVGLAVKAKDAAVSLVAAAKGSKLFAGVMEAAKNRAAFPAMIEDMKKRYAADAFKFDAARRGSVGTVTGLGPALAGAAGARQAVMSGGIVGGLTAAVSAGFDRAAPLAAKKAADAKAKADRAARAAMATPLGKASVAGLMGGMLGGALGSIGGFTPGVTALKAQTNAVARTAANPQPRFAEAAVEGSREAYDALLKTLGGRKGNETQKEMLKESREQTKVQKEFVSAVKALGGGQGLARFTL